MKVKYIGKKQMDYIVKDNFIDFKFDKIYEVLGIDKASGFYRIVDESEEDYCYPASFFEIVEGSIEEFNK